MRYSGSKKKFVKKLLPILLKTANEETLFVDAFGGGMNVICEVPLKYKLALDTNKYIIALWQCIRDCGLDSLELPKNSQEFTVDDYNDIKRDYLNHGGKYPDYLIGYVGACCSYGGAWFNGYAHFNPKKNEDHIAEAYNGLKKQVENFKYLETTMFECMSYTDLNPQINGFNTVIYCDPPYANTKKYESDFDTLRFWDWVRGISEMGNVVYSSEYQAPDDFITIWSDKKKDGMGTTKNGRPQNTKIEKLFIHKPKANA